MTRYERHGLYVQSGTADSDGLDYDHRIMTMSLPGLIVLLIIAAVCGAIGRALAGGGGGLLTSIVIGFVGAFVGPWVAHQLKLSEPLMIRVSGESFPILWSIIGAALFVATLHLLTRRRRLFS
jgi:uncharacterized membrane protein YeaQ/YmgE (transglycosylase-associated protein family)